MDGRGSVSDVVVTVPKRLWADWIAEGDLPGEDPTGDEYGFFLAGPRPIIQPGERVYIVAHDKLRGYAPLTRVVPYGGGFALCREGNAVACTIDAPIRGFRGWRYRWWDREDERPFPDWRAPEIAQLESWEAVPADLQMANGQLSMFGGAL